MTAHFAAQTSPAKPANIEALQEMLPDFAKDIRLNLSSVLKEDPTSGLALNQVLGIALACAYATRNQSVADAVLGESVMLSPEEVQAAKAAATIMAMNNVYYRFVHLSHDEEMGKMPAGLRMNVIVNSGIDKVTFELYSIGVSAINGCGMCIESHVRTVQQHGVSKAGAQHAARIGAVLTAAAQALSI